MLILKKEFNELEKEFSTSISDYCYALADLQEETQLQNVTYDREGLYVVLHEGSILFRGQRRKTKDVLKPYNMKINHPTWFAIDIFTASRYGADNDWDSHENNSNFGFIAEYKTCKPIRLLDISKPEAVEHLIELVRKGGSDESEKVIELLKEAFIIQTNEDTNERYVERWSDVSYDFDIFKHICSAQTDFAGYFWSGDGLRDEIMLCSPSKYLELVFMKDMSEGTLVMHPTYLKYRSTKSII